MATLKQRMHKKNSSGTYDTVHLETSSSLVLRPSGRSVEDDLTDYLPKTQDSDTPPSTLKTGLLVTGESKLWVGINELPVEVSIDMGNTTNIVTITQIPTNEYGYRVQLFDADGVSPLSNVVISGVSDPSTEIRTNSEGIVTFYSSASSQDVTFSGYPSYLDASMFPSTLQGYINDTSVVIVKPAVENYYGYDIAVTDNSGNALANTTVYQNSGTSYTSLGTTDNTGHLKLYRTVSSLSLIAKNSDYYATDTVTGTLGSLKTISLKTSNVAYSGTLSVGNTITFAGKSWIVCHKDGDKYYLALSTIASKTTFGTNTAYADSTLASVASSYQSTLTSSYPVQLNLYCQDVTVNSVTSKIFVASYDQMIGGFSYFSSSSARICNYDGSASYYWTSSPRSSSDVYYVNADGSLVSNFPSNTYGFRPFACITI